MYGYIPYMALALYAGLGRVDQRLLETLVWAYLAWLSVWHDPELQQALMHSLRLAALTTLVAVPSGSPSPSAWTAGGAGWRPGSTSRCCCRSCSPRSSWPWPCCSCSPTCSGRPRLGTVAQLLGLVTFQLSYPVIICRARLLSIGREYEEAAMDLGASHLSADTASEPMSVKIYNSARSSPTPALNALATIMLASPARHRPRLPGLPPSHPRRAPPGVDRRGVRRPGMTAGPPSARGWPSGT